MVVLSEPHYLTPEEYLVWETQNASKHEYRQGEAYAMAGTTDRHNILIGNLYSLIRAHLRGSACRVYFAEVKARLETRNCFYYPDLMVTGDPRDPETPLYKRFPKLIVEVLSESTEAFDRGDKFNDYQTLETLTEYVLINTQRQRIEIFRRNGDKFWFLQTYQPEDGRFELQSLQLMLNLADLYEDTRL
jgi:Uma2 family endonuclease